MRPHRWLALPIALPEWVDRFDTALDKRWEPLRANPLMQRAAYTASELGDFGVVWMFVAAIPALGGSPRHGKALVRMGVALGIESLVVNQGLKRLFRRPRPQRSTDDRHALRMPLTSSFPSGHATSAMTAAMLLPESLPGSKVLIRLAAGAVAASRVQVRAHHGSDVVGGIAVGYFCGRLFRRLIRIGPG
jgi:membrane-associated phospholipid phosphatase